jgi:hypothetical protein
MSNPRSHPGTPKKEQGVIAIRYYLMVTHDASLAMLMIPVFIRTQQPVAVD